MSTEIKKEQIIIPDQLNIIIRTSVPGYQKIEYKPSMTIKDISEKTVIFNPLIKLQQSVINKIPQEYRIKQFFNKGLFQSLVNYNGGTPAKNLVQSTRYGYVDNNINVTLNTIFQVGSIIYIGKNPYVIADHQWTTGDWKIEIKEQKQEFVLNKVLDTQLYDQLIRDKISAEEQLSKIPQSVIFGTNYSGPSAPKPVPAPSAPKPSAPKPVPAPKPPAPKPSAPKPPTPKPPTPVPLPVPVPTPTPKPSAPKPPTPKPPTPVPLPVPVPTPTPEPEPEQEPEPTPEPAPTPEQTPTPEPEPAPTPEPEPPAQQLHEVSPINDYKTITWYKNSCYFSVAMWFLWTINPFREFINKYSGDNDGFKAIQELFDEFIDNSKSEPINIEGIYPRVFDSFVKRRVANKEVKFGDEESSAHLIGKILEETKDQEFLNKIGFIFETTTGCNDKNTNEEIKSDFNITYSTNNIINIFNFNYDDNLDIKRCDNSDGYKITKLNLANDDNKYFILEFTDEMKYSNVNKIIYDNKTFKIKSVVSYLGNHKSGGGHYIYYVFDNNGTNPIILDDIGAKRQVYKGELDEIKINSLVLYKLSDEVTEEEKNTPFTVKMEPWAQEEESILSKKVSEQEEGLPPHLMYGLTEVEESDEEEQLQQQRRNNRLTRRNNRLTRRKRGGSKTYKNKSQYYGEEDIKMGGEKYPYYPMSVSMTKKNYQNESSKIVYTITIDMELHPGTTLSKEQIIESKCNSRYNAVRKAFSEFTGRPYVIPPVYPKSKNNTKKNIIQTKGGKRKTRKNIQ